MKNNLLTKTLLTATLLLAPSLLKAQGGTCLVTVTSCSLSHTVTLRMPVLASMSLSNSVTLPSPAASDFTAGQAVVNSPSAGVLSVKANKGYSLSVQSNSAFFDHAENKTKPASDLSVQIDGQGFVALSDKTQSLIANAPRTASTEHSLGYRATYHTQDAPGTYAVTLTYSLSAL